MNDVFETKDISNEYRKIGVEKFYKENALTYINPHKEIIHRHLGNFIESINLSKDSKILDLCCGGGKVSELFIKKGFDKITGLDPYTSELYQKNTNKPSINLDFKDIAKGKLNDKFDIIICSFALHLAEPSLLPMILYNLKQISDKLVILTPHKKPDIKDFFNLEKEYYGEKVRLRYYT